ncbi:MAG: staygreen family protein, partial [Asgard group archaeon]|nr:staygreen family protein [Asgard group archaeon]
YTLTHSDFTGELFLTIGQKINKKQISKVYIRLMRDEIVGEWRKIDDDYQLHLHAHISGGLIFGWARLRDKIIRHHLPLVFSVIQYGDRKFFEKNPKLDKSPIFVHFHSKRKKFDSVENMGVPRNYRLSTTG